VAKILVVEDEEITRVAISEILTIEGHTITQVEDGIRALESAGNTIPDLIVCDIEMPRLKGFDVLEELRKNPETASVPFIFLTGRTDISALVNAMELDVNDFLTKPFSVEELIAAVNNQLNKAMKKKD
jgi:DNA-binding response OmpR family regulator